MDIKVGAHENRRTGSRAAGVAGIDLHAEITLMNDQNHSLMVADRHSLTRCGIISILEPMKLFELVAESDSFISTMRAIQRHQPLILIFEPRVLGKNPAAISQELAQVSPLTKQIIMLDEQDSCCELTRRMPLAGGLLKTDDLGVVRDIIFDVANGQSAFSERYKKMAQAGKPCEMLTERERQIMSAILRGSTSRDIAEKLGISVKTVENHRTNLMRKLNVHSVATLSHWARQNQCVYGVQV